MERQKAGGQMEPNRQNWLRNAFAALATMLLSAVLTLLLMLTAWTARQPGLAASPAPGTRAAGPGAALPLDTGKQEGVIRLKRNNSPAARYGAAMGAALLAVGLLASCAARENTPVVTNDDLAPISAAQEVLDETEPEPKNYAYIWEAEHIDAMLEQYQSRLEECLRAQEKLLADGEEAAVAAGYASLENLRQTYDYNKDTMEQELKDMRSFLENQRAIDPAVSAQEAANLAGAVLEQLYGVDLKDKALKLGCYDDVWNIPDPEPDGVSHPRWLAELREEADGVLFSTESACCEIDATTGELRSVSYAPDIEKQAAMEKTPLSPCFVPNGHTFGRWQEDAEGYGALVQRLQEEAAQWLSGSLMTGGAKVTEVRTMLAEHGDYNQMRLIAVCEDGKVFTLERMLYVQAYTEYAYEGWPMRAYAISAGEPKDDA